MLSNWQNEIYDEYECVDYRLATFDHRQLIVSEIKTLRIRFQCYYFESIKAKNSKPLSDNNN